MTHIDVIEQMTVKTTSKALSFSMAADALIMLVNKKKKKEDKSTKPYP